MINYVPINFVENILHADITQLTMKRRNFL